MVVFLWRCFCGGVFEVFVSVVVLCGTEWCFCGGVLAVVFSVVVFVW